LEVRGNNTKHSGKKTVDPVVAANPAKLLTTVKPSYPGDAKALGTRPLAFTENKGQFDKQVKFQVSGSGGTLWLTDSGIVFDSLRAKSSQNSQLRTEPQPTRLTPRNQNVAEHPQIEDRALRDMERHIIFQDFVGASHNLSIETKGLQQGTYNYLSGSDPSKWQTLVRGFSEVVYRDVWNGVDLRLCGNGPNLEQEFIVAPGADLSQVQVAYQGIESLRVDKDGPLLIKTAAGHMRESAPRIYQEIAGRRIPVEGRFKLLSATSYTFEVSAYNAAYDLVVDPTLLYSTFLGGSAGNNFYTTGTQETATGLAVDAAGNAYVTGYTLSTDFPSTPGAQQTNAVTGSWNSFVSKLNPTGTGLTYSTYLNGTSGSTFSNAIAVDQNGNAYVTGYTSVGGGFPATPNAYAAQCNSSGYFFDFFMAELNSAGNQLLYSTCLNVGSGIAYGSLYGYYPRAIAVDTHGHVYVAGGASGEGFPTTPNAYESQYTNMPGSAFLSVFDTTASGSASLTYSTYLSIAPAYNFQSQTVLPSSVANAVAVDSFGKAYVAGDTTPGFPVTPGAFQTTPAGCSGTANCTNAFIAKIDPTASGLQSLIYSTYLGGSSSNNGVSTNSVVNAIAVDSSGAGYVTGYTSGSYYNSFPITPGAFQSTAGPSLQSCFVTKLNAAGSNLVYSTYLAGNIFAPSSGNGIAVDSVGNAYIAGQFRAQSLSTFPVTPDAFQNTFIKLSGDFSEAFLTKLSPDGSALVYSSYLGGRGDDVATAVAVDQAGDAYTTGHTSSGNFPIILGAFQPGMDGTGDAFVTKFPLGASQTLSISSISPSSGGNVGTVTGRILGAGFHVGASVMLTGPTTVTATSSAGTEGRTIDFTFDLAGVPVGSYGLNVVNPDGTAIALQNAFTIESGGGPQLGVSVVMPATFAINRGPTVFNVEVRNTGNVDAQGVLLAIDGIPSDAILTPLFAMSPYPDGLGGQEIDFSGVPFAPVVGEEQFVSLLLPLVPAGNSVALNFSLALTRLPQPASIASNVPNIGMASAVGPANTNLTITARALMFADFICNSDDFGCVQAALTTFLVLLNPDLGFTLGAINCITTEICTSFNLILKQLGLHSRKPFSWTDTLLKIILDCAGISVSDISLRALVVGIGGVVKSIYDCTKHLAKEVVGIGRALAGFNYDPNDKEGLLGVTSSHWIQPQTLEYGVYFSNIPSATAAAANVLVADLIDPSIELSTVSLDGLVVAGNVIPLPPNFSPALGHNQASTAIDFRPAQHLLINVSVSLNPASRILTVQFASVDPTTGLPPSDPSLGVLPPGAEGSVIYTATPLLIISTGTQISNQATIVFDTNAPMTTQTWINTIDNTSPVSHVVALPSTEPTSGFTVIWSGTDVGSGIQDFAVYVSDNGGPFTPFQTNTAATSAAFAGQVGHTYGFYSIARDLVGNVEAAKSSAEATTQVTTDTTPPVTTAVASPVPNGAGWNDSNVTITLNSTDNEPGGTGVKQIQWSLAGAQTGSSTVPGSTTSVTISSEGTTTLTYFGTDNAGNIETAKTITIKLDKTPPSITGARSPAPNPNGWNNTSVTVSFTCSDSLSGLAAGSPPPSTVFSAEGAGQSVSGTCTDVAGNSATSTVSGINIDKTAPVVTASANPAALWPPNGKMVTVTVSGAMSDNLSGINPSTTAFAVQDSYGLVQPGGLVSLAPNGTYSFTVSLEARRDGQDKNGRFYTIVVSAQDNAGNPSSARTTVIVPHDQGN